MSKNYKKKQYTKVCKCCGKEFITNRIDIEYCFDEHYVKCEVCGKEYHISRAMLLDRGPIGTCSAKCSREKAKQTMLEKYGVENPSQSSIIQEKKKQTNIEKYGTEYPQQNQKVKDKIKNTNLEKYGVDNVFKLDSVKEQINQTNLEKYGAIRPLQNEDIKQKEIKTNQERYGGNSPLCNKSIQEKARKTNQEHLGVDWPGLSNECNQKARQTCLDLYGNEHYTRSNDYKERVPEIIKGVQKTMMDRYGSKTYGESEEYQKRVDDIKEKRKNTMLKRYGTEGYPFSKELRQQSMTNPSKIDEWMEFINEPVKYIQSHYNEKPTIHKLKENLGVQESTIDRYIHNYDLFDYVSLHKSILEQEIIEFLLEYEPSIQIKSNIRSIIPPLEIDIYLPDYKIGIECNPTATHNSSVAYLPESTVKEKTYHQHKTDLADKNGIFLFHLFGYEWSNNCDIMKSMILNLINKTENKIYARQCEVKEVSNIDCQMFLNSNHRQGNTSSKIRLGLYHNNELVSVMTFGKMRSGISSKNEDLVDCYELIRFCNKINTNVVGGASKLFNYFTKTYNPNRVRSFSDRAHTKGTLYPTLGFTEIRRSVPGYVWVDVKTDIAYNRVTCQKQNLKNFLKDDTIDLSKTEKEIMEEHGFVRIYDSGTILWEYTNKK